VSNPSGHIAYAVELKAYTGSNKKSLVAPVFYEDNLFTLFPGESRNIDIAYNRSDLKGNAFVTVNCYNNAITGSDARAATDIYKSVMVGGSSNIARDKTVTGGANPENITAVAEGGQANAVAGKTFIDSNVNTFATVTPENASFIVDLGSVQLFDRMMLRWNRTFAQRNAHNLRGRPDHIKIEVSNDNISYTTLIADFDNSAMGSIMTNIILPAQAKGQYIKITPSGLVGISPAVGMRSTLSSGGVSGQSVSGIAETAASTAFTVSAVEVYAFYKSAFFTVEGDGKVQTADKTFCSSCIVNKRVVPADEDNKVTFKCLVPTGGSISNIKVFRDNTDISSSLAADGTLTLTDVTKDTDIIVKFN
jgi:hypothetical protein